MLYVITNLDDNSIVIGPVEWNSMLFSSIIADHLEIDDITVIDSYKEELPKIIANFEIRFCAIKEETYDPLTQILSGPFWSVDDKTNMKICEYKAKYKPILDMRSDAKKLISEERWKKENLDIEVTLYGQNIKVSSNRELRKSLFQKSIIADEKPFIWKFKNKSLSINKDDLHFLIKKIDEHVQSIFDWEAAILDQIKSTETVLEIEQILKNNIPSLNSKRRKI